MTLVELQGKTDADLVGSWRSTCVPDSEGSHRLSYSFTEKGLEVVDASDVLNAGCENPALVITYRLNVQPGTWSSQKAQARSMRAELKQVTVRTESEQLTHFFNRDTQCGLNEWVKGKERDITKLSCLGLENRPGLAIALTSPTNFTLWVEHVGRDIMLSSETTGGVYKSALNRLFVPEAKVLIDDGRDLGLKFWNNEIPKGGTRIFKTSVDLNGKGVSLKDGEGYFQSISYGIREVISDRVLQIKDNVLTFSLEVPVTTPAQTFEIYQARIPVGSVVDTLFTFEKHTGLLKITRNDQEIASLPMAPPTLEITAPAKADTEAPAFELLEVPRFVGRSQSSFEIRVRASDNLSGFLGVRLQGKWDNGSPTSITSYGPVYEGQGVYRLKFFFTTTPTYKMVSFEQASAYDRAGNLSGEKAVDIQIIE